MTRIVGFGSVLLLAALTGCGGQTEGDRCQLNANDCQSGLVCKSLQSLTGAGNGAICCPASGNASSTRACRPGSLDFPFDENFSEDTSTSGSLLDESTKPALQPISDAAADAATPTADSGRGAAGVDAAREE